MFLGTYLRTNIPCRHISSMASDVRALHVCSKITVMRCISPSRQCARRLELWAQTSRSKCSPLRRSPTTSRSPSSARRVLRPVALWPQVRVGRMMQGAAACVPCPHLGERASACVASAATLLCMFHAVAQRPVARRDVQPHVQLLGPWHVLCAASDTGTVACDSSISTCKGGQSPCDMHPAYAKLKQT
jgi:hypothetical protein